MDPSIMKLLEEDEDETMHSGADVEAFTAALNRDIGGGGGGPDHSQSQPSQSDSVPLSQASSYTSNQLAPWQASNHDENASRQNLQDSDKVQQNEGNLSDMQPKQQDADSHNQQQKNESSQESSSLPLQHIPFQGSHETTGVEQDKLHVSKAVNIQIPEKNTQHPESQHLNLQGANNQQSIQSLTTGASGLPLVAADASKQSELATGSTSQAAMNIAKQGKQVPFAPLSPHIQPQLDKDRAMQLQTLYLKLKKNEISKEGFIRHMRSIIGDQMLKMAVYKIQSQASKNSQTVPGQLPPQSQASLQQHSQLPMDGTF